MIAERILHDIIGFCLSVQKSWFRHIFIVHDLSHKPLKECLDEHASPEFLGGKLT